MWQSSGAARPGWRWVITWDSKAAPRDPPGSSELAPAWPSAGTPNALHPRRYSALPGLPLPGDPDGYPARDEVITYLGRYANTFELPIELNSRVEQLGQGDDGRFRLSVGGPDVHRRPGRRRDGSRSRLHTCRSSARSSGDLFQTHAVGYRKPGDVPKGTVLVVGGRNTGFQIAKELRRRTRSCSRSGRGKSRCHSACLGGTFSGG